MIDYQLTGDPSPDDLAALNAQRDQLVATARDEVREKKTWLLFSSQPVEPGVSEFHLTCSTDSNLGEMEPFIIQCVKELVVLLSDTYRIPAAAAALRLFNAVVPEMLLDGLPDPDDET